MDTSPRSTEGKEPAETASGRDAITPAVDDLRTALRRLTSTDTQKAMDHLYDEYRQIISEEEALHRTKEEKVRLDGKSFACTAIQLTEHLWIRPRIHHVLQADVYDIMIHVFDDTQENHPVAHFNITEFSRDRFELPHRFVEPSLRKSGLGSVIINLIDQFVQAAAEHRNREQTTTLEVGQYYLIKWLKDRGFSAMHPLLLADIERRVQSGDLTHRGLPDDDYLYPKDTPKDFRGVSIGNSKKYGVRLSFEKHIKPKEKPEQR